MRHLRELIKFILASTLVILFACKENVPPHSSISAQAISLRGLDENIIVLGDQILYHKGDLQQNPDGSFDYKNPNNKWSKITLMSRSTLNAEGEMAWTQLPLPETFPSSDNILFIKRVFHFFEVYLDDQMIYSYGDLKNPKESGFHLKPFHFIRLKHEYTGKTLYFRHWSNGGRIGFFTKPYITSERRFFSNLISEDFPQSIICLTAFALAFFILLLPASKKDYILVLSLSLFMTFAGLYLLSRLDICSYFFDSDVIRVYMEWIPLYGFTFSCSVFVNYFLQSKILNTYIIFSIIMPLLLFFSVEFAIAASPWSVLKYIQGIIFSGIIIMFFLSTIKMLKGDKRARIIWIGFLCIFIVTGLEILMSNGFLTKYRSINLLSFGFLGFLVSIFFVARVYLKANAIELLNTSKNLLEKNAALETIKAELELANKNAKDSKAQIEVSHKRVKYLLDVSRQMGLKESPDEAIQIALQQLYKEFKHYNFGSNANVKFYEWTLLNNEELKITECKKLKLFQFQYMDSSSLVNLVSFESKLVEPGELEVSKKIVNFDKDQGYSIHLNWGEKKIAEILLPYNVALDEPDVAYIEALAASLSVALVNILSHQSHNESLVRLVSLASDISDRLNSPLLVVINALGRLKNIQVPPEIKTILNYMETSLLSIEQLSRQLSEVRDASHIEATKTFSFEKY